MKNDNQPLVSVPVITYNSSKYVIETLESIKAQTYPKIELIVSDDCSTDNTVELCRGWIEKNKDRFVRTELLTVEKNTGISANANRAGAACRGEWIKGIAGDDLLLPECVQLCIDYVRQHEDVVYLFGKIDVFGARKEVCENIESVFDYSILKKSAEEQLYQLLFSDNYIPASTAFYNKGKVMALEVKNDERIPLLEDWPKWINVLKKGVTFHFIDSVLVRYRIGGISTNGVPSMKSFESDRLFRFYYQYPAWLQEDEEMAIKRIVEEECSFYQMFLDAQNVRNSHAYRLGKFLLRPFSWMKRKLSK